MPCTKCITLIMTYTQDHHDLVPLLQSTWDRECIHRMTSGPRRPPASMLKPDVAHGSRSERRSGETAGFHSISCLEKSLVSSKKPQHPEPQNSHSTRTSDKRPNRAHATSRRAATGSSPPQCTAAESEGRPVQIYTHTKPYSARRTFTVTTSP